MHKNGTSDFFFGLAIRSVFFSLSLTACQKRGEQLSSPNGQPVHEMAGPFSNMNGYCYFILGILILAAGYFTYGRVLEKIFRPDASRQTPAVACTDGVDYVVMPRWRVFLIQLLNIAGLGPIFGAVMGVLYGPAALLWIVIGCIFGGMVHDYFSGMISLRHKGENLPEILGRYLGSQAQWISRAVCIVFSVLVGVVFAVGPAAILAPMAQIRDGIQASRGELARFRRERLGFVFQDCNLLDTLTAFENIALALSIVRTPAGEIREQVEENARLLGIQDCLDKYPYQMSGGQQQRCAAARAIVTRPALVLADEPTGALDSRSAKLLLDRFEALNREGRATILMVTHDAFAASWCSRIIFIRDGALYGQIQRGALNRTQFFETIVAATTQMESEAANAR